MIDFKEKDFLGQVIAWLFSNQMRSEGVQRKLLVEQCLMNVWRKRMFQRLVGDVNQTAIKPDGEALDLFRYLDYTIENAASAIAVVE